MMDPEAQSPYVEPHVAGARPWPPPFSPATRVKALHLLADGVDVPDVARRCDCTVEPVRAVIVELALGELGEPDAETEAES